MKAVFEPEILFISESDWQDPEKRDVFLNHLLETLENINNYKITKVYWTDDLEELLWEHPQLPPWRRDRDWNLQIVPIIYRAFNIAREFIQSDESLSSCLMQPVLNCSCFEGLALSSFLELMHIVDSHLQDEYLKQKKEYRFRITQRPSSTRIHYKYVDKKMKFLRYYDEGEHDDGL